MSTTNVVFKIQNSYLWPVISKFLNRNNAFETAELWCIVYLKTILRLLQRKKLHFFFLVKKVWAQKVA